LKAFPTTLRATAPRKQHYPYKHVKKEPHPHYTIINKNGKLKIVSLFFAIASNQWGIGEVGEVEEKPSSKMHVGEEVIEIVRHEHTPNSYYSKQDLVYQHKK